MLIDFAAAKVQISVKNAKENTLFSVLFLFCDRNIQVIYKMFSKKEYRAPEMFFDIFCFLPLNIVIFLLYLQGLMTSI